MGVPLVKSTDMEPEIVSEIVDSIGTIVDKFANDANWEVRESERFIRASHLTARDLSPPLPTPLGRLEDAEGGAR